MNRQLFDLYRRVQELDCKLSDMQTLRDHYEILRKDNRYLQQQLGRLELDNDHMKSALSEFVERPNDESFDLFSSGDIDLRLDHPQLAKVTNRTKIRIDAEIDVNNNDLIGEFDVRDARDLNDDLFDDRMDDRIDDRIDNRMEIWTSHHKKRNVMKDDEESFRSRLKIDDVKFVNDTKRSKRHLDEDQPEITSSSSNNFRNLEFNEGEIHLLRNDNDKLFNEMTEYKRLYEDYKNRYDRCHDKLEKRKKKYKSMRDERNELKHIEIDHDKYINELKLNLNSTDQVIVGLETELKELRTMLKEKRTTEFVLRRDQKVLTDKLSLVNGAKDNCENCVRLKQEKDEYEDKYTKSVKLFVLETTKK